MWDPDDKKTKPSVDRRSTPQTDTTPRPPPAIRAEEDIFREYAYQSHAIRVACGVRVFKGKILIEDKAALDKLPAWKKDALRDVCKRLCDEYNSGTKRFWLMP